MPLKLDLDDLDQIAAIHAPHLIAPPGIAPSAPQIAGPGLAPDTLPVGMSPAQIAQPTREESQAAGKAEFQAGKPTVTDAPGTSGYFGQRIAAEDYDKAHPWGSPISEHPGFLGKVAHGFAKAGNIAGDILAPGTMANIPGTDLNKQVTRAGDENRFQQATQEETQKQKADTEQEGVEQRPEIAEATGELKGKLAAESEASKAKLQGESDAQRDKRLNETLAGRAELDTKRDREKFSEENTLQDKRDTAAMDRAKIMAGKESGSYMPLYDEKGHAVGAWNPKTGTVNKSPDSLPGTTGQGQHIASTNTAAQEKALKPYQDMLDSSQEAHSLQKMADGGNAEADVDLALDFFKMIRGAAGSGVRFTQQESNLIMKTRPMSQDLEAYAQKVIGSGAPFTPDQRKKVVDVIDMHAQAAQKAMDRLRGGQSQAGAEQGGGESQGIQVIRDANGRIVGVK